MIFVNAASFASRRILEAARIWHGEIFSEFEGKPAHRPLTAASLTKLYTKLVSDIVERYGAFTYSTQQFQEDARHQPGARHNWQAAR